MLGRKTTYRYGEIQPWPAEETHGNEEVLDERAVKNGGLIMGRVGQATWMGKYTCFVSRTVKA